jgi:hypothetical protein
MLCTLYMHSNLKHALARAGRKLPKCDRRIFGGFFLCLTSFSFLSFQTHQRLLHSKSCVHVHVQVEATSNKCPSPQPDAASAGAQELMRAVGTTRASNPGLERARDWGGPFQTCNLPLPCRVGSPNASHFAGGQPQPSGGRRRQRGGRLTLACRA